MKKFVLLYLLALLLLFTLFYADTSILSRVLNDTQSALTLMMLEPFLKPGQLQGIDHHHYPSLQDHYHTGL
ncbi:hypothetical protein [Sulfurovum mangrovi]|uniref:hypothetical protein n=1 Tax=Sulfurovum mangrovi TaxID=2893889 RepID=UPI001E5AC0F3|nr:hypothetical protein [Sulfurovum mangrovi]UFH60552.1 hypothetical protein LN246_13150 [Sulfurovum mangrovi]